MYTHFVFFSHTVFQNCIQHLINVNFLWAMSFWAKSQILNWLVMIQRVKLLLMIKTSFVLTMATPSTEAASSQRGLTMNTAMLFQEMR